MSMSLNGTLYCRTCGFSDCPSLTDGGGCPRWPAPENAQADFRGAEFHDYTSQVGADIGPRGRFTEKDSQPAPSHGDPAFALLTLDDLYDLHARLCKQGSEIHATLMGGQAAIVSPLSDEWAYQAARADEINKTAETVYAEITRREVAGA